MGPGMWLLFWVGGLGLLGGRLTGSWLIGMIAGFTVWCVLGLGWLVFTA